MKEYSHVYADTAYHNEAFEKKTSNRYFEILRRLLKDSVIKKRILFGTDWPMSRHTWKVVSYVKAIQNLPEKMYEQVTLANPLTFLFPHSRLPQRVKSFYERNGINASRLPQWMRENLADT